MDISKNKIIIISGVAGSGKDSVFSVLKKYPKKYCYSVSYTSRKPREGEVNGADYQFISQREFDIAIEKNQFLEWEQVHFDKYGTKKYDFEKIISSGKIPVLILDVKGMMSFKKKYDNVISIFIVAPTIEEAMRRLKKRNTETEKTLKKRISRYKMEMSCAKDYDYIIVNDDLERTQKELLSVIENCTKHLEE